MDIETAAKLIQRRVSYIDSVELQQKRYFRAPFLKLMEANCGSTYGPVERDTYSGRILLSLWLHQPLPRALECVDRGLDPAIVRVEVALDLVTATKEDARKLQTFLVRHLFPFARPAEDVKWERTTAYFGYGQALGPGKSVAIYADKESKAVPGAPCCHVEWRLSGAKALRDSHMQTPMQLLHRDHSDFWQRSLRLVETPTREAVGQLWVRGFTSSASTLSRKLPFTSRSDSARRVPSMFLRPHLDDDGEVRSNNDLAVSLRARRKAFPGQSIAGLFKTAPSDWLIPPAGNALWESLTPSRSTA